MSRQLIYKKQIPIKDGAVNGDGEVILSQPLRFKQNSKKYIRLITASIPANIPNITPQYNNNTLSFTLIEGIHTRGPYIINLSTGIYTYLSLQGAINSAIKLKMSELGVSVIPDLSNPPIKLYPNNTLQKMYIEYNPTLMCPPVEPVEPPTEPAEPLKYVLSLNLGISKIHEILGFNPNVILTSIVDQGIVWNGTYVAQFDYFGTRCDVHVKGVGPISVVNGRSDTIFM